MSAWIVSRAHIDALVQGLSRRELVDGKSPDEVGRILWEQNRRSVIAHYDRCPELSEEAVAAYRYRVPSVEISKGWLLTAVRCYCYQSCETDDWDQTTACAWIRALGEALRAEGTSLDDGPWGLEEEHVHGPGALAPNPS